MKSLPWPPKMVGDVLGGDDEVVAGAAEDQIVDASGRRVAGLDDVVAVAALEDVVAAHVRDDVVAGAAEDDVVAEAALEAVVAGVAVERVVAIAGDDDVVAGGAAEHDVVFAGVLQVVGIGPERARVVADDQRRDLDVADDRYRPSGSSRPSRPKTGELLRRVDLEGPSSAS